MDAARRIARRFIERHQIETPIQNLDAVASRFAEIETDHLPDNFDGILLRSDGQAKIILDPRKPPNRYRFTLAHELGHLIIPWHIGMVACHTQFVDPVEQESEANEFASELLMPESWLRELFHSDQSTINCMQAVSATGISSHAACIALCRVFPPGYCFAIVDQNDRVKGAGRSPGSHTTFLTTGMSLKDIQLDGFATKHESALSTQRLQTVHWWSFEINESPAIIDESSASILNEILMDCASAEHHSKLQRSIMGRTGYVFGVTTHKTFANLMSGLLQRFATIREADLDYNNHPRFRAFLEARANELLNHE